MNWGGALEYKGHCWLNLQAFMKTVDSSQSFLDLCSFETCRQIYKVNCPLNSCTKSKIENVNIDCHASQNELASEISSQSYINIGIPVSLGNCSCNVYKLLFENLSKIIYYWCKYYSEVTDYPDLGLSIQSSHCRLLYIACKESIYWQTSHSVKKLMQLNHRVQMTFWHEFLFLATFSTMS